MNTRKWALLSLVILFAAAGRARSAPVSAAKRLAERLPDRSIAIFAWSGSDQVGEAFQQSALGQILAEPSIRTFISEMKKVVPSAIREGADSEEQAAFDAMAEVWPAVVQSPGAGVVIAGDPKADFALCAAVVLQAGKHRETIDAVRDRLRPAEPATTEFQIGDVRLRLESDPEAGTSWGWVGDCFVLGVGDMTPLVQSLLSGKQALSSSPAFARRLTAVPAEQELMLGYFDPLVTRRLFRQAADPEGQPLLQKTEAVLNTLGLSDLEAVLARVSVRGPELLVNLTAFAPSPRRGLLRCLDGSVGLDRMDGVPAGATEAGAGFFRIADLLPMVIETVRAAAPDKVGAVTGFVDEVEQQCGVPIRKQILENFTGAYTYYLLPQGPGGFVPGVVIVLDVNNGAMAEDALAKLEVWAGPKFPPDMASTTTKTIDSENVTIHTWNLLAVDVPAQLGWSVCKGKLVIELSAGGQGGGVEYLVKGGPRYLDDPATAALARKLPPAMNRYSFSNDKARVGQSMQQLMMVWSGLQMALAKSGGVTLPFLPPADDIVKHLGVSMSYSYSDDVGLHARAEGAIPGGDPVVVTAASAAAVSVLLPSLSRARELSKRLVSAANLKGILTCCKIYALENDDKYPPSLQTLIDNGEMTPKQVQNPRVDGGNADKPDHYIYIPGHTDSDAPDLVVVYENPAYVDEGINIGFVDGHVQFYKGEEAFEIIRATYGKTTLAVPDLRYEASGASSFLDKFDPSSAGTKGGEK